MLLVCLLARAADPSLAASPSAFVRAQAASGVEWHAWSDATLAAAQKANRSIYVFVGTPLSELTRATLAQTFSSAKTVEWVNQNFFCIFVDADERPDIAAYGQHYLRTIKQLQGAPVHLWLTPELQVYDGANYLPPSEEWGKPGFLKSARSALETWSSDPARARALAKEAVSMMRVPPLPADAPADATAKLDAAAKAWIATLDPVNGGFGSAPKQPEPELIRFLLARGDPASRDAALNAARALVNGAAHDPADGGFYRRCIDEAWKEPYLQKTVADQARIALALLEAADVGKEPALHEAAVRALSFSWDLRRKDGTFAAAVDGTLDVKPAPRVGTASAGSVGLLAVALIRSGDETPSRVAKMILAAFQAELSSHGRLPHLAETPDEATAADYAAVALAFRFSHDNATADRLLARANELYFDSATGAYQAAPKQLPAGIGVRAPASGDVPSAEVLALLAGVDDKTAGLIRRALLATIEYDDQPPGDVLLGLSQK